MSTHLNDSVEGNYRVMSFPSLTASPKSYYSLNTRK
jgi:hypothetical protein